MSSTSFSSSAGASPDLAASDPCLALLERVQTPFWVFNFAVGRIVWANVSALAMWRAGSLDELRARDLSTADSSAIAARLRQFRDDFESFDACYIEEWTFYPRGEPLTRRVAHRGYRLPDGKMGMLVEILGEVRFESETAQRSLDAVLHTSVMISQFDLRGRPLYRNPAAHAVVGDGARRLTGHFADLREYRALRREAARNGTARAICRVRTVKGESWHEVSLKRCLDSVSGKKVLLISEVDVSELKRTEAHASYLARHDTLTGLPNRQVVLNDFASFLAAMHGQGQDVALLFIDLDDFKTVNDSLGHQAGDDLLIEIARRLRASVRDHDMVARLGGDEFLVLTSAPGIRLHAEGLARRMLGLLSREVMLQDVPVRVTPSIGVCIARPGQDDDILTLMQQADLAMYRAKAEGRNRVVFFSPDMQDAVRHRLHVEADLRHALHMESFELHYQPRVCVNTGQVLGAEALVRWRHPVRGVVSPGEFIPLCEENGLIVPLGNLLLRQGARQLAAWQRRGFTGTLSLNVSARQFVDGDLVETFRRAVRESGCDARCIEFEITESLLVGDDASCLQRMQALREMGCRFAVDDFGTGYSNLAYLRRYPIDTLKIDRSFIAGLGASSSIARLIVTLCEMIEIGCVAEGVETPAQLEWLRENRVAEYQGYLFSPPLGAAEFERRYLG